jgi:hypothetical protein
VSVAVANPNAPPTVAIISPTNNATFTAPADITIMAQPFDSDGSIRKVEFFQGATKLGESTNTPYSILWSAVAAGAYVLTASATDDGGAVAISDPVNITVNSPSTASIVLVGALAGGDRFNFSFATEINRTYTVEHTLNLSPANWQTLTNLVGDGSVVTATDGIQAQTQQFYRVKTQ